MGEGSVDLQQSRTEFRAGYLAADHLFSEAKDFNQLARTARTFVYRVGMGMDKKPGMAKLVADFELAREARERREVMAGENVQSDLGKVTENAGDLDKISLSNQNYEDLRRQVREYLRREHGYFFHIVDNLDPEARRNGRDNQGAISRQPEVEDQIISAIGRYVLQRSQGLKTIREPLEFNAIRGVLQAVVPEAAKYRPELAKLAKVQDGDPNIIAQKEEDKFQAAVEATLLDPNQAMYAAREWRRRMVERSNRGIKIYETPYYENIFRRCDIVRDKQNGLGGKVFYGPPGTGKTEIALYDAQERNGFKARVVSMHYWSSFNNLVYETSVKVAGGEQKHLSYQQRMTEGIKLFSDMDGETFKRTVTEMVDRLKAQKKVGEDVTTEEFLTPFMSQSMAQKGGEKKFKDLKQAVIAGLQEHAMAATFGQSLTEEDFWEEVVKGELLLAIDSGQDRIILDEGDKAGPFAWAGISRVLSMSPGEQLDIRGRKIEIPSNLRFDVTVNSMDLDEYVKSRFNEIYVTYPPAKDEMMIASVWLSDNEGEIILSEEEQLRVAAFFTYVLPEIRELYDKKVISQPFDLRVTRELCNLLVDPTTKQRTSMTVDRAVDIILNEQRAFSLPTLEVSPAESRQARDQALAKKQQEAFGQLEGIIRFYNQILKSEPVFAGEEDERYEIELAYRRRTRVRDLFKARLTRGLGQTLNAPLARASVGLPDRTPEYRKPGEMLLTETPRLIKFELNSEAIPDPEAFSRVKAGVRRLMETDRKPLKSLQDMGPVVETAMGFGVIVRGDGSLALMNEIDGQAVELFCNKTTDMNGLVDVSPDGRYALACDKDNHVYYVDCWSRYKQDSERAFSLTERLNMDITQMKLVAGGKAILLENSKTKGDYSITFIDPEKREIKGTLGFLGKVDRCDVSEDGNYLLAEIAGDTWFIDMQDLLVKKPAAVEPTTKLRGQGWKFIGRRMIVNPQRHESFLVTYGQNLQSKLAT